MFYHKENTWNPDHCPGSRLVKLKELDTLQHLVRKYPDVAMDCLSTKRIVSYVQRCRQKEDFEITIVAASGKS